MAAWQRLVSAGEWLWILAIASVVGLIMFTLQATVFRNETRALWLVTAAINGLLLASFAVLLSGLVLVAARYPSKLLAEIFLVGAGAGCAIDAVLLSFHALQLLSRCRPESFDDLIKNCRQVLDNGLTVLRHGNLLALIVLVALLHGVVLVAAVAALGRVVGRRKSWPVVPLALGHASTQV